MASKRKERVFRFKQFACSHEKSAMKIGVDSVLLGSWANLDFSEGYLLDVGTGCGVLALMCAQRHPSAIIDAIEVEPGAYQEAAENFVRSPWADRLHCHLGDFSEYVLEIGKSEHYSRIISNPPYFSSGLIQDGSARIKARHQDLLSPMLLLELSSGLLIEEGRLAMIIPDEQVKELEAMAYNWGLHLVRMCRVRGRMDLPVKRTMLEFIRPADSEITQVVEESELILELKEGVPTDAHRQLCRDFYLKF